MTSPLRRVPPIKSGVRATSPVSGEEMRQRDEGLTFFAGLSCL